MLPSDAQERKEIPIYSGFICYFPHAIAAGAQLSFIGNKQHNPGEPLHWAKEKSADEQDAQMRHIVDNAISENGDAPLRDTEGVLHAVKNFWRAGAHLERLHDAGVNIFAEPPDMIIFDEISEVNDFPKPEMPAMSFSDNNVGICPGIGGVEVPQPRKLGAAPARECIYVVQFRSEANANGLNYTIYEGPFLTREGADDYARRNPNNITGIRSIHTINKP